MFWRKRKERIVNTKYIFLDANKCEACWNCLPVCGNNVIGRVNLFFHKHARLADIEKCIGCRKCVKICPHGAIENI